MEKYGGDAAGVAFKGADAFPGSQVPEFEGFILAARQDEAAVRADGQGGGWSFMSDE